MDFERNATVQNMELENRLGKSIDSVLPADIICTFIFFAIPFFKLTKVSHSKFRKSNFQISS